VWEAVIGSILVLVSVAPQRAVEERSVVTRPGNRKKDFCRCLCALLLSEQRLATVVA